MKKIIYLFAITLFLLSCDRSMDEINTNPDGNTQAVPSLLSNGLILNMTSNTSGKNFLNASWAMKYVITTEIKNPYQYNSFGTRDIDYTRLTSSEKMISAVLADNSISEAKKNAYKALDIFATAFIVYHTTIELGDVPFSEKLGAQEGNYRPKYDTQEEVFAGILNLLDEANTLFGTAEKFDGDPIYDGDVAKWQNLTNSFMLSILNQLSAKQNVESINVQSKFEEVAKRNLIQSSSDDFARLYNDIDNQYYPFYYKNHNYTLYMYVTKSFVDLLKKYNDNRIFYYLEPASKLLSNTVLETDFAAYDGIDGSEDFTQTQADAVTEKFSMLNLRYSDDPVNEPVRKVSYVNTQFILAEAALRGWSTPSSAETHYNNAVSASIQLTTQYTKETYRHGVTIDDDFIQSYLAGDANYTNSTNKLQTIIEQKYIASFMQNTWEVYYDYRRTGYPKLSINPNTSMNEYNKEAMPLRWTYPSVEYSSNNKNVIEATIRQFGTESETINDKMWLLK